MDKTYIGLILVIILSISLGYVLPKNTQKVMIINQIINDTGKYTLNECKEYIERLGMYNQTEISYMFNNGYYNIRDEYYCVWTKGKRPDQIANTEQHEICHALIYQSEYEYNHFCNIK